MRGAEADAADPPQTLPIVEGKKHYRRSYTLEFLVIAADRLPMVWAQHQALAHYCDVLGGSVAQRCC